MPAGGERCVQLPSDPAGIVTNLTREIELARVEVVKNTPVDAALVEKEAPDAVVVATGASPRWPEIEGVEHAHVVDAWQVLKGEVNVGSSVVVADWRSDWVGILHTLGVEIVPYARLFGADADTVYMQHTASGEPVIFDEVDTLVLAQGHEPVDTLAAELAGLDVEVRMAGDCLAPRTAEEAVFEGLKVGTAL